MTTAAIGPRSNRIISRLSHIRDNKKKEKEESVELKLDIDNLPIVDRVQPTQQKKRIHQIILNKNVNKKSIEKHEEILPYEVEPTHKFRQTLAGGFRTKPSSKYRTTRYQSKDSRDTS